MLHNYLVNTEMKASVPLSWGGYFCCLTNTSFPTLGCCNRVPLNLTFTHCHSPSLLPSYPGKMGRARTQLGQSDISCLTCDSSSRQWQSLQCGLSASIPTEAPRQDHKTGFPAFPLLGPRLLPITRQRMLLSIWLSSLCLWEDILSLQLEGDKWLILANGLWVEMTCHFLDGALNCQDAMAFFPTSANHKHG